MNSLITIQITGKNVKRFLVGLHKRNINFYDITYLNHERSVQVTVNIHDYHKIKEIKTIYEIHIVHLKGWVYYQNLFKRYQCFLFSFLFGLFFLIFLSNIIFSVEVIHNSGEVRSFIGEKLEEYGIKKFGFVKSFAVKEKIISSLMQEHNQTIEWIDLTRVGTKYEVRVEVRKTKTEEESNEPRDLIAKKKGIILSIEASTGEVIKKVNDYVSEGDTIISGAIHKNEEVKSFVHAKGKVFAETWYQVRIEIPQFYKESSKTGNAQKALTFKFLNFEYTFPSNYKTSNDTILFSMTNSLFPFGISFVEQEETKEVDILYTNDKAIEKAYSLARERLLASLGPEDEIIYEKNLKNYEEDSKIIVEIFFKVKEDITSYMEIAPDVSEKSSE